MTNDMVDISPIQFGNQVKPGPDTHAYNFNQEGFVNLAQQNVLSDLIEQGKAIRISLDPEIEQLTQLQDQGHEGYLSVHLPMVGIADYLNTENSSSAAPVFGSVLGLNQFTSDSQEPYLSRPDFIVAKDIVGNEYEILVEPNGKVVIPEEGMGKFSILSEIKLMYGLDQVLEGRGLLDTHAAPFTTGAEPNSLYLLPPPGFQGKYVPIISVSQTQEDFSEKELSSRKIPILLQNMTEESGQAIVSESSLHQISKYLFTEYDFTKAILAGDEFGVTHEKGLNNFGVSPEAIGVYYDLWLNGVVHHQISAENFLSRVDPQELLAIQDFAELGLSPAEQLNMQTFLTQIKQGDFSGLQHLYEPLALQEGSLSTINVVDNIDNIDNELTQHVPAELGEKIIFLSLEDVLGHGEHGASISNFHVGQDKLNLSNLLNQLPDLTVQNLSADLQGKDVKINYADPHTGEIQTLATLISAAPDDGLPNLSHYLDLF